MKVKKIGVGVGAVVLTLVAVAFAPAAFADPINPTAPPFRAINGSGSDTTQDVMNALANSITDAGQTPNKYVASWNPTPAETIPVNTDFDGAGPRTCTLARPNGSGAGRTALVNSENPAHVNLGCFQYARSSNFPGPASPTGDATFVPFAVDALSLAINTNSDLPRNLTFERIQRVYKCLDTTIGGEAVTPRLIQSNSGTWQFWIGQMEITESEINFGDYLCLTNASGVALFPRLQEHDGRPIDPAWAGPEGPGGLSHVVPFSISQWIAQHNDAVILAETGVTVQVRFGPTELTGMRRLPSPTIQQPYTGTLPNVTLNPNYGTKRDVYNAVRSSRIQPDLAPETLMVQTFAGLTSKVCTAQTASGANVIQRLGFGLRTTHVSPTEAACGYLGLRMELFPFI